MKLIFFRKLALGVISGLIITGALLLFFALILSKQDDPTKSSVLLSWIALGVGALVAGKLSALGVENKLIQALMTSATFVLILLALSVAFSDFNSASLLKALITALLTFSGAMIGKKTTKSVSSSKRRKNVIKRYSR